VKVFFFITSHLEISKNSVNISFICTCGGTRADKLFGSVCLLELEHDFVPPVPELHGAVVAGRQEVVAVHLVKAVSFKNRK